MSDDWPSAGTLLATRYRLAELLETGGMAEIWRADDELLGRPVAVKLPTGAQVAWREARMAAKLSHPGIAAVHDYREAVRSDGTVAPFVVMELLAGETVAARLVRAPIGLAETARIGAAVADALAAAHANGVVHRDVKPGNVMLTPNGVKILDFGISAAAGEPDDDDTGATFGTPAYVAPERLDGMPAEPATDVYGLGVLLFEMVTGQPPYPVDTWEELEEAKVTGPSVLPDTLPEAFCSLVMRCLDDDPEKRPPADEVRFDLTAMWLSAPPAAAGVTASAKAGALPGGDLPAAAHWDGPIAERITYQEPLPARPAGWHEVPAVASRRNAAPPAPDGAPAGWPPSRQRPRVVLHGGEVAVADRSAALRQPTAEMAPPTGHPSLPGLAANAPAGTTYPAGPALPGPPAAVPPRRRFALSLALIALVVAVGGIYAAVSWPRRTADTSTAEPAATPVATPSAGPLTVAPLERLTTTPPTANSSTVPSASASATTPPLTFTQAVSRMRSAVLDGAAAGEIRDDVATDLLNLVEALSKTKAKDAGGQVDHLRLKLRQRQSEGESSITQARATILQARLDDLDQVVKA
jgi:hypothetical protein